MYNILEAVQCNC